MDAPALPAEVRDGDERATLVAMLEYYRAVLVRKAWGLSPEQLAATVGTSTLTLGGLLKHMAWVENFWFSVRLFGEPPGEPWASAPWDDQPDWEFTSAAGQPLDELVELFDREVAAARRITDASDLDRMGARAGDGGPWNLRWLLVHMIEEYARHCGHADLLREAIDGRIGDD